MSPLMRRSEGMSKSDRIELQKGRGDFEIYSVLKQYLGVVKSGGLVDEEG